MVKLSFCSGTGGCPVPQPAKICASACQEFASKARLDAVHGKCARIWRASAEAKSAMLITLCLWLVALFCGCGGKAQTGAAAPSEVEFVAIEQKDVPIYNEWVGTLAGDVNASIRAQVSGYLTNRAYVEGSMVTNGQVLFQIDSGTFEATVAKAKAELEAARARKIKTALDVQRYTPLAATEAISRQELDDAIQADKAAEAQVDSAQAVLRDAELNLGFTTIRAPVDGVAGLAKAQIGDLVGPSSGPLTTVTKIHPIRAYFSVSEQLVYAMLVQRLAEGADPAKRDVPLELMLAGGSMYPEKGRVRFSDNRVDVKTGTIELVGEFPNPNGLLSAGMFARVRALVGVETNALLVPQRAVAEMQGRYLLACIGADNKISIRPVSVGERTEGQWIIESKDLKMGDRVVAEGIQKVRDGVTVNPIPLGSRAKAQLAKEAKSEVQTR